MDAKKTSKSVAKGNSWQSFVQFFGSIKQELKHVSWTSKEDLKAFTKVVLGSTVFFGMLIYFEDLLIQFVLFLINGIVKLITG